VLLSDPTNEWKRKKKRNKEGQTTTKMNTENRTRRRRQGEEKLACDKGTRKTKSLTRKFASHPTYTTHTQIYISYTATTYTHIYTYESTKQTHT
jgi:hypothetical protein